LLAAEAGCVSYHAKPLSDTAAAGSLAAPSMAALKIEARQIKHPILNRLS